MADTASVRARALAETARHLSAEIKDLEERLSESRSQLNTILCSELVDLLMELDEDHIGLPARGNLPAVDLRLEQYCQASIPKSWPDDRRQEAFDLLPMDLVKVTLQVAFSRHQREQAEALAEKLRASRYEVAVEREVHHKTLTSWLKKKLSDREQLPPLESIGATVGSKVTITERRD